MSVLELQMRRNENISDDEIRAARNDALFDLFHGNPNKFEKNDAPDDL